ncbi:hypothetical protein KUCAC02_013124, partial [Chaenocephalus aceratus]
MTTRKANSVADTVTTSTSSSSTTNHQNQPRSRSPSSGVPGAEAAGGGAEMFGAFQDWCLRTYGDTGKTKTVTRRKYNKILQTLVQGDEENSNGVFLHEKGNNHINAKFKFWVKSKGFQVGTLRDEKNGSSDRPVLYVPIKATCVDGVSGVDSSLKRVAVVEDFFDIIYAMHVEMSTDPGKAPKHAGQKKTYKAIAETYAFLPREAVTHFLMSCGECQKRMHISTAGQDYKENDRPSSLVLEVIDYNMPLTHHLHETHEAAVHEQQQVLERALSPAPQAAAEAEERLMCCIFGAVRSSTGSLSPHPKPPLICPSLYLPSISPPSQFNKRRKLPGWLSWQGWGGADKRVRSEGEETRG